MTVAELLSRISSKELSEWMIFHRMEPFGGDTKYMGAAITSKVIADVNRKPNTPAYEMKRFMPNFEEKKAQTDEGMLGFAKAFTASYNDKGK